MSDERPERWMVDYEHGEGEPQHAVLSWLDDEAKGLPEVGTYLIREEDAAPLAEALRELVRLKDLKETDPAAYRREDEVAAKEEAWHKAREILSGERRATMRGDRAAKSVSDVSPVDEQARERVARAIFGVEFGDEDQAVIDEAWRGDQDTAERDIAYERADAALAAARELTAAPAEAIKQAAERYRVEQCASRRESPPVAHWLAGYRAALAAARLVPAQARERTPWTGRALFERFEHEAERGRGWPRLSKVGKHSWDALAEQIEGEVLAAQPVPEDAGDERQPGLLAVEKLSRARKLAEAILRVRDDDCGLREIAAEIVSLLAAVPSVAQAPTPEDDEQDVMFKHRKQLVGSGPGVTQREIDSFEAGWLGHKAWAAMPGRASTGTEDARDAVAEAHDYHLHDRTPMVIEAVAQALYRADEPSSANARAWACAAPKSRLYYLQRARESIEAMARPVTGTEEER